MKVFRVLCLIIHSQVSGLPALIKDNVLLPNCLHAITKVLEKNTIKFNLKVLFLNLVQR
jgi:hypothetical protein